MQVSTAAGAALDRERALTMHTARLVWQGSDRYRRNTRHQGRKDPIT